MKKYKKIILGMNFIVLNTIGVNLIANDLKNTSYCTNFGPQSPRNIDNTQGTNPVIFSQAPSYQNMNLCNIHFHHSAEHQAKAFINLAKDKSGYVCNNSNSLSQAELKPYNSAVCDNIIPGETIEVHWVYTSCDVKPGKTLSACVSEKCTNPNLRVESQIFMVVNDSSALNFNSFDVNEQKENNYYQAKSLPNKTGFPIVYIGSTTGGNFNLKTCSPFQVTWSVRPQCTKINIASLQSWCQNNIFNEKKPQTARELITELNLLSQIK